MSIFDSWGNSGSALVGGFSLAEDHGSVPKANVWILTALVCW